MQAFSKVKKTQVTVTETKSVNRCTNNTKYTVIGGSKMNIKSALHGCDINIKILQSRNMKNKVRS